MTVRNVGDCLSTCQHCIIVVAECLTDPTGLEYRGHQTKTISGRTCQDWAKNKVSNIEATAAVVASIIYSLYRQCEPLRLLIDN